MTPLDPISVSTRPRWTIALTSVAFFMVVLDALAVTTALPAIHRDLGASLPTLQWTLNAYTLAWAAAITTAAALGDRYGRRRMFAIGLTLFAMASAACALAPTAEVLIGARALQGIGAGIIMPLSLTILTAAFPPERRGAMIGIWGCIAGIAAMTGPLIGGAVTQGLSWEWVFWVNVPIGIVASALALLRLSESFGPPTRLDPVAVILVSGGVIGIVFGLVRAAELGWLSVQALAPLGLGVVLMGAFLGWERRAEEPMLPLRLFRSLPFSAANTTSFFMSAAQYAGVFLIVQYYQLALGNSPFETGVRILPWTATPLMITPFAGALSDRIGRRPLLIVGMLLQGIGFAWFAVQVGDSVGYWAAVIPLVVAGVGASIVIPVATSAALGAVERDDMGKGAAVNSMLQRFGSSLGVAVATAVFTANGNLATSAGFVAGIRPALVVVSGLSALGALAALAVGGRRVVSTPSSLTDARSSLPSPAEVVDDIA